MIVAAHQPHFFPCLGYFHLMGKADLFVSVEHGRSDPAGLQAHARVRASEGPFWLELPVLRGSLEERLCDARLDHSRGPLRWGRKMFLTLKQAYGEAPYFAALETSLLKIFDEPWERLVDLNHACIELVRAALDIRTPVVLSSELGIRGERPDMLLELCRRTGADAFLAGQGPDRLRLDLDAFEKAGIGLLRQGFAHPVYPQHPPGPFEAGLSALDLLANCGPRASAVLEDGGSAPAGREVAA